MNYTQRVNLTLFQKLILSSFNKKMTNCQTKRNKNKTTLLYLRLRKINYSALVQLF